MEQSVRELLNLLDVEPITGRLWIVESGRIRIHESTNTESGDASSL